MKKMLFGFTLLLASIGFVAAEEYTGKLGKISTETDKQEITVTVDGKEKTFAVDKTATFSTKGKNDKLKDLKDGIKGLKEGTEAVVTTDKRDGKEVVTKVVVSKKKKD